MGVKKNHARIILNAVTELRADSSTTTNTETPAPRKTLVRKSSVKIDVEVTSSGAPASPPKRLQRYAAKTKSTDLTSVQRRLSRAESLKEEETAAKVAFAATQNLQAEERALKAKAQADVVRPAVQRRQTEQRLRKAEERKAEAIQQKTKFSRSDSLKVVETQAKNLIADAIGGKNAAALEARARTADERKAEADARKVAFARSDSLKGEKARVVSEMTQHCRWSPCVNAMHAHHRAVHTHIRPRDDSELMNFDHIQHHMPHKQHTCASHTQHTGRRSRGRRTPSGSRTRPCASPTRSHRRPPSPRPTRRRWRRGST